MTTTKLKVSGEVDSYCTKCKLDLAHRIIAMVGDVPKKVECRTCGAHHLYRRPKALGGPEKAPRATSATPRTPGGKTASARAVAAMEAELKRERTWEKQVSGKAITDFKVYRTTQTFGEGDLLRHAKFGDGYVLRVVDKIKIGVMFKDGEKTLAHAMEA